MPIQAESSYIDLAQLVLYAFWIFFAGLLYYLLRENKREGYPLESDRTERAPRVAVQGYPPIPEPKTYTLPHGGTAVAPNGRKDSREIRAEPAAGFPGAPLTPTGDPMVDGVGPAAWAQRADEPDRTYEGDLKIVPLRVATDHAIESRDPDPRGMPVIGADGLVGGTVVDTWVDRSESVVRYLEVEANGGRRVLLPMNFARVKSDGVHVKSILSTHFAKVPGLRNPDAVTLLEEDKIVGFYGGGHLYALPQRAEPVL